MKKSKIKRKAKRLIRIADEVLDAVAEMEWLSQDVGQLEPVGGLSECKGASHYIADMESSLVLFVLRFEEVRGGETWHIVVPGIPPKHLQTPTGRWHLNSHDSKAVSAIIQRRMVNMIGGDPDIGAWDWLTSDCVGRHVLFTRMSGDDDGDDAVVTGELCKSALLGERGTVEPIRLIRSNGELKRIDDA